MSSPDEAGPSRRSGRRTPRVRYDVTSAFEGIEGMDEDPERRPASSDDSSASEMYAENDQQKGAPSKKGKGKATIAKVSSIRKQQPDSSNSDSDFDENEIEAEVNDDLRMDNMSVDSSMDEDDEEFIAGYSDFKPQARKRPRPKTLETFRLHDSTPRDNNDTPDDKAIIDFNTIYDPGHTVAHKYVLRRDLPKAVGANRWTQTPVRPMGITVLKEKPHLGRLSEVENKPVEECGSKEKYFSLLETLYAVPHEIPWDMWSGEGWWSDCWSYDGEGNAQWKPQGQVGIGLEDVGRVRKEDIRHLDAEQARPYLIERTGYKLSLLLGIDDKEAGVVQEKTETEMFTARKLGQKQANLFDAGGFVSGIEWCPMSEIESSKRNFELYLAVSTLDPATQPNRTGASLPDAKGSLQIWTVSPGNGLNETGISAEFYDPADDAEMRCSMVLCFEGGPIIDFKWMPIGCCDRVERDDDRVSKIGIISAVMTDGSVRLFAVPDPRHGSSERTFVHVEPLLILRIEDGACTSLDWGSAGMLAVGMSSGSVCVWDNLVEILTGKETILLPTNQIPTHASAVKTVRWARMPAADAQDRTRLDIAPPYILSASWDGTLALVDMRDGTFMCDLEGQPRFHGALDWSGYMESILWVDGEYYGLLVKFRRFTQFATSRTHGHEGPILCFGASDFHGMLATGGADGVVGWTNSVQTALHYKKKQIVVGELYQLDFNQNTGEYRMLDRKLPDVSSLTRRLADPSGPKYKEGFKKASPVWPAEINITGLAWNNGNGIGRAGMLASGSASGLCRVDFMRGHKEEGKLGQFRRKMESKERRVAKDDSKQMDSEGDEDEDEDDDD